MLSINWEAVKDTLAKEGKAVLTLVQDTLADRINIAGEEAFAKAIEKGISITTSTLYEANVADNDIIILLNKHWGICREEAKDRLVVEKTIEAPCRELKSYLELQGFSREKIHNFMVNNHVTQELRRNPDLGKLWRKPDKLLEAIEASKNTRVLAKGQQPAQISRR